MLGPQPAAAGGASGMQEEGRTSSATRLDDEYFTTRAPRRS